jgi:putative tryptophan/tyrosine transport system substrate-binding protein
VILSDTRLTLAVLCSSQRPTDGFVSLDPRIGVIAPTSGDTRANKPLKEAFLRGLREHGYVEGESIAIIWQDAEGKLEQLPHLAADLVRLKVDLIYATTTGAARAARQATTTIPIVCPNMGDPVSEGLAASLARM